MTATDTEAALLAAIRANPGEDAPRLVYADSLEENAGTVACAACDGTRLVQHRQPRGANYDAMGHIEGCPICHGTGRVSDGRAELAEFIRVQAELANNSVPNDATPAQLREAERRVGRETWDALRRRESELWPTVRGVFEGEGVNLWCGRWPGSNTATPAVLVSRGLPAVVRCTLAEWMGGECERCDGYGLREAVYNGKADPDCPACHGTGRTPGIGPRLAQTWPVVAVEAADDPLHLPSEITNRFPPGQYTLDQFRSTLSDAAIAWARGQEMEGKR